MSAQTGSDIGSVILNRYEITKEIARGGYGVVFKARDTTNDQVVAIKRLLTDDETQVKRFDREMTLTSKLKNPHTVRLLNYGHHENSPIMVMEFVEGQSLHERLVQAPMSPETARRVIMQVLESLAEAHSHGIVHRDMKPLNIMLTGPADLPEVKLLDFGTAGVASGYEDDQHKKITKFGEIQGTPSYMAPEQIVNFADACTQSDLYAVGLILFECLTRKRAVTGRNSLEICSAQVQKPLDMPPDLKEGHFGPIIDKACAKATQARYQTASDMLSDLAALDLTQQPRRTLIVKAVPSPNTPSASDDAAKIARQTMLIAVISVLLVVGLVCAVLFL